MHIVTLQFTSPTTPVPSPPVTPLHLIWFGHCSTDSSPTSPHGPSPAGSPLHLLEISSPLKGENSPDQQPTFTGSKSRVHQPSENPKRQAVRFQIEENPAHSQGGTSDSKPCEREDSTSDSAIVSLLDLRRESKWRGMATKNVWYADFAADKDVPSILADSDYLEDGHVYVQYDHDRTVK
ncbi:hypothetical protein M422DRAFT_267720 [Sphaerobolus stellatus SS14]|uniref:Uncharacterized protein n=1 Tax=Sphaerobolus stellatus (strain SS14) TaxID=990650 RepID=A0A0C9U8B4_SPHS4|nr:hypothetical protein M422DRAFT_267720 [Sphaerobolus stellatus SS14]